VNAEVRSGSTAVKPNKRLRAQITRGARLTRTGKFCYPRNGSLLVESERLFSMRPRLCLSLGAFSLLTLAVDRGAQARPKTGFGQSRGTIKKERM
jgi:hypothetical protein